MGLLDRLRRPSKGELARDIEHLETQLGMRSSIDDWLTDYLLPAVNGGSFGYGGNTYSYGLRTTWNPTRVQEVTSDLPGHTAAVRMSPPAFAAQMVRALVISQARFRFRNNAISRTPGRTFGTSALGILEKPWPNAGTGELLGRMEWHAGLAGNSFVCRRGGRLRVLRPDWTAVIYGSELNPEDAIHALDSEVVGYIYAPGGWSNSDRWETLLPNDVAHWSPIPDPLGGSLGVSWLTPAIRDIQGDRAATEHKVQFFNNGATPNLVVKGIPAKTKQDFLDYVDMMEEKHAGVRNAYKTLYLTLGADATVVGADLKQLDFKATQGAGETRIAFLSRVPAPLLGISEGLAGSSLNAGNFGMARRMFADTWVYPTLQNLSEALAPLVGVPADADLWFDTTDIPLLREDAKDAAEIADLEAETITKYVREGFTPESSIAAVKGKDVSLLEHTGLVSVQLQPPGAVASQQGDQPT